jgi:large subunit ribosomal protein L4
MVILKKYDIDGEETGIEEIEDALLQTTVSAQLIKDYIVVLRNNARQWSASTQGRSEVSVTKKKPHAQKGLGRARQGSFAAPQYKGGGVVFGPKPKFDQSVRMNRKEKKLVVSGLLQDKVKSGEVCFLDIPALQGPKTKVVGAFLHKMQWTGSRVLFWGAEKSDGMTKHFIKSVRNIPKVRYTYTNNIDGYKIMLAGVIVVLYAARDEFLSITGNKRHG